jgi:hypothetical protein
MNFKQLKLILEKAKNQLNGGSKLENLQNQLNYLYSLKNKLIGGLKPCKENQERNPKTNRCRKICGEDQMRSDSGRCVNKYRKYPTKKIKEVRQVEEVRQVDELKDKLKNKGIIIDGDLDFIKNKNFGYVIPESDLKVVDNYISNYDKEQLEEYYKRCIKASTSNNDLDKALANTYIYYEDIENNLPIYSIYNEVKDEPNNKYKLLRLLKAFKNAEYKLKDLSEEALKQRAKTPTIKDYDIKYVGLNESEIKKKKKSLEDEEDKKVREERSSKEKIGKELTIDYFKNKQLLKKVLNDDTSESNIKWGKKSLKDIEDYLETLNDIDKYNIKINYDKLNNDKKNKMTKELYIESMNQKIDEDRYKKLLSDLKDGIFMAYMNSNKEGDYYIQRANERIDSTDREINKYASQLWKKEKKDREKNKIEGLKEALAYKKALMTILNDSQEIEKLKNSGIRTKEAKLSRRQPKKKSLLY